MQYLLLIFDNEQQWASYPPSEMQQIMGEYRSLTQSLAQSGSYKGGNQLQPVNTATTIRVRNGKRQTTDGPFAETREQLGGYYLVDAPNLDEAIAIAERIPAAKTGCIEVRPIVEMPAVVTA
ncbi:MAG TPA: YciI family protein [Gemmatimonadaceae bacterium]|nr:YciI family protein [Gemmatimonadaceae bacterium]